MSHCVLCNFFLAFVACKGISTAGYADAALLYPNDGTDGFSVFICYKIKFTFEGFSSETG